MQLGLLLLGLTFATVGGVAIQFQRGPYTHLKAVCMVMFVIGEVLLFGQKWWWGIVGLAAPPILFNLITALRHRRR